jgi:hypothetical protein
MSVLSDANDARWKLNAVVDDLKAQHAGQVLKLGHVHMRRLDVVLREMQRNIEIAIRLHETMSRPEADET